MQDSIRYLRWKLTANYRSLIIDVSKGSKCIPILNKKKSATPFKSSEFQICNETFLFVLLYFRRIHKKSD